MKPKTMILMGLAITCGLGASYMTSQLLAERQPTEDQKIAVLVAKRNLSIGEPVRKPEDMFETKQFVLGQEPKEALQEKDLETVKGKMMKQSLRKGDHITPNDLSSDGGLQIPEGHYALGFPVNNVQAASGFATLPLSRVDILFTMNRADDKNSKARILLRNVLVLAADMEVSRDKGMAAPAQVVTFALKPEEALKMQIAKEKGTLTLALRKPNDKSNMEATELSFETVLSDGKEESMGDPKKAAAPVVMAHVAPKQKDPPKVTEPTPTPTPVEPSVKEEPKAVVHTLVIQNGASQQTFRGRVGDNGQIQSDEESDQTPPRRQPSKKKAGPSEL